MQDDNQSSSLRQKSMKLYSTKIIKCLAMNCSFLVPYVYRMLEKMLKMKPMFPLILKMVSSYELWSGKHSGTKSHWLTLFWQESSFSLIAKTVNSMACNLTSTQISPPIPASPLFCPPLPLLPSPLFYVLNTDVWAL